ncbi:MAG: amino acid ABC transporter permease [Nitrososphaera sp.]|nr:amino acid ABC transporter permease [Nitrososphaera sp.]
MTYSWDYSVVFAHLEILLRGMGVTLLLTTVTVLFGLIAGCLVAIMRSSKRWILSWSARSYIEIFRDLPVLVTLIWLYFCLPIFLGPSLRISPFWVAVIGLGLNFSALQAEITRAGFEAIPVGETEAARGLDFTQWQILRFIVIPQAFWRSLAPTLGQTINTLKLTALASFIVVPELFYETSALIQETYRPLELYTTLAVLYLALILPFSLLLQALEARLAARFRKV